MARELISRDVDGSTYQFEQFNTTLSLNVLIRLSKIVGKPLALALGAVFGDEQGKGKDEAARSLLEQDLKPALLAEAMDALMLRLDEKETIELIKTLAAGKVLADGRPVVFDVHYEGRLDHLFRVVQAALEVQYGNFFGALIARVGSFSPRSSKSATSPASATSIGESGGP